MSLSVKIITGPAFEPVTVAEMRDHSRIDSTTEDAYINALIKSARMHVESVTRRALITQTWEMKLNGFPNEINLPLAPLQSVTSVKYLDINGTEQTLSSSVYTADTYQEPGRIYLSYDQDWPSTRSIENAVTVRFVAGYTSAANVPDAIRHAIKLLAAHYYEIREPVQTGSLAIVPMSIDALLAPYRVITF